MPELADTLIFGCGYTGAAVARRALARGERVVASVRSASRAGALAAEFGSRMHVLVAPELAGGALDEVLACCAASTHVVVAFPPDGASDARVASRLAACAPASVTYVSSTGVYGSTRGVIDDTTPLPATPDARAIRVLAAESAWRAIGATVLRCPAIYGADRGIHVRIARGEFRITGDGSTATSRIHVDDLAQLLVAARGVHGETFVVGDRAPATQHEMATWVCREYGVPFPPSVAWEEAHETLRADRRIDPSRALATLSVTLTHPTWETAMRKPKP